MKRALRQLLVTLQLVVVLLSNYPCALAQETQDEPINTPVKDKWALVIGISQFKDSKLNLKYPAKDAKDFANFLITKENFAPDHILTLTDQEANRENILDAIGDNWLPRVASRDDLVLIFISSHGSPSTLDVGSANYLIAHDTDQKRLYSTAIAMQDLCRIIRERVFAKRAVILLDACHSGATDPSAKGMVRKSSFDAEEVAQGTGQLVICSSDQSQTSWESSSYPNGIFTHHLMKSLQQKGEITPLGEAFTSLKSGVEEDAQREHGQMQSPIMRSKWQGNELVLGIKPTAPRKTPPELLPGKQTSTIVATATPNTVVRSAPDTTSNTVSNPVQKSSMAAPPPVQIASNTLAAPAVASLGSPLQGRVEQKAAVGWQKFLGTWRHNDDEFSGVTIRIFQQEDGSIAATYEKMDGTWAKKNLEVGDWLFVQGQPNGEEIVSEQAHFYPYSKTIAPYTKGSIKLTWGPRPNQMLIKRQNYQYGDFSGWTINYPNVAIFPDEAGWKRVDGAQTSSAPAGATISASPGDAWRKVLGTWEHRDDDFSAGTVRIFEENGGICGQYMKLEGEWAKGGKQTGDYLFKDGKPNGSEVVSTKACYYYVDGSSSSIFDTGSLKVTIGARNDLKITRQNYDYGGFSGWTVGYPSVVNFPKIDNTHWKRIGM